MTETIVISVGGSLICPDKPDVEFLKKFKEIIEKHIRQGKKFILITGGGQVCRDYQIAASQVAPLDDQDLDWLGIHTTRINGHLLRSIFREYAHHRIISDPYQEIDFKEHILVAAGWKPGRSTDNVAVILAKNFGVKKLINLTNVDYVYNKDPAKHEDAKAIKKMRWVQGTLRREMAPWLKHTL